MQNLWTIFRNQKIPKKEHYLDDNMTQLINAVALLPVTPKGAECGDCVECPTVNDMLYRQCYARGMGITVRRLNKNTIRVWRIK